jgi:hypothetical protein
MARKQKAESRKQKAESRKQKAESRKQKAESRKQKAESRKSMSPGCLFLRFGSSSDCDGFTQIAADAAFCFLLSDF